MARSHHRKKHKEHLRQFQHSQETNFIPKKGKAKWIITIVGSFFGLAISYFAAGGAPLFLAVGLIAGTAAGYFIGRNLDKPVEK